MEGVVSDCCGDPVYEGGICKGCHEHCGTEPVEPDPNSREFSPEQEATVARMEAEAEEEQLGENEIIQTKCMDCLHVEAYHANGKDCHSFACRCEAYRKITDPA